MEDNFEGIEELPDEVIIELARSLASMECFASLVPLPADFDVASAKRYLADIQSVLGSPGNEPDQLIDPMILMPMPITWRPLNQFLQEIKGDRQKTSKIARESLLLSGAPKPEEALKEWHYGSKQISSIYERWLTENGHLSWREVSLPAAEGWYTIPGLGTTICNGKGIQKKLWGENRATPAPESFFEKTVRDIAEESGAMSTEEARVFAFEQMAGIRKPKYGPSTHHYALDFIRAAVLDGILTRKDGKTDIPDAEMHSLSQARKKSEKPKNPPYPSNP